MSGSPETGGDLVTVELHDLPVPLQARMQEHSDELVRELTLIAEQMHQRGDAHGLPVRLVELITTLTSEYSMFTVEQEQRLADAVRSGIERIDLTYRIPPSAAGAAAEMAAVLAEADDYCRAGRHLLTLATPTDLVTYRNWFLDQFVDQIAGRPPVSWPDYAALRTPAG
jgi:hypothetical protein